MANYFRSNIQAMSGYVPGEQPGDDGFIKLNTNENPYPPSPKVYAALRKAIGASLRLYPQPMSDSLCAAAAAAYGIKKENIMAGNGSDELLSIILRCFVGAGDRVAYPVPTYSLYDTLVEIQAGVAVRVPFPEDFAVPEELARQDARADDSLQSQCAVRDAGAVAGNCQARPRRLPAYSWSTKPMSISPPVKAPRRFR